MQRHAINRACQLIEELGAGEVVGGMVDVYTKKKEPVRIPFQPEQHQRPSGNRCFRERICFLTSRRLISVMTLRQREVIAPTFRHDLFRMADLAEEVARFYGYDNIPTTLPKGEATTW